MRLIDGDNVKENLQQMLVDELGDTDFVDGLRQGIKMAIDVIDEHLTVDAEEFIEWLLDHIWDEDEWYANRNALDELILRKLSALGYIKVKGDKYVRKGEEKKRPTGMINVVVPKEEYFTVIGLLVSSIVKDHGDEKAAKFLLHHFIEVMKSKDLMKEYMKWQEDEFAKRDEER